jgi:hypothetical protein
MIIVMKYAMIHLGNGFLGIKNLEMFILCALEVKIKL